MRLWPASIRNCVIARGRDIIDCDLEALSCLLAVGHARERRSTASSEHGGAALR